MRWLWPIAIAACTPPEPMPPRTLAEICVVRPESTDADATMKVTDNGRLVGATRGATYFCYLAEPGDHQIRSDADDTGPTFVRAVGGARYWLHQEVVDPGTARLDWIDEPDARERLSACNARVLLAVPGHDDAIRFAPAR